MSEPNWLDELKPGDKVAETQSGWSYPKIATVTRVTATQVEIHGKSMYFKRTGQRVGDSRSYFPCEIQPVTDALEKRIRVQEVAAFLSQRQWGNYPMETLESILALVQQAHRDAKEKEGK